MEFLLSIVFEENVWTFVGGIKSANSNLQRTFAETEDYEKPYRILVPSAGKRELDISGSGIIDNNKAVVLRMLELSFSGSEFRAKIESLKFLIEGSFIFESFSLTSPVSEASTFDISIKSSNDFSITDKEVMARAEGFA